MAAKKKKTKSLPSKKEGETAPRRSRERKAAQLHDRLTLETTPMNDDLRREMIALLQRIVGDGPLTPDLQRQSLKILASLGEPPANAPAGAAALATGGPAAAVAAAAATAGRKLVYVHGICRHNPGYSNDWWDALRPFVPTAFGSGQLDDTRLEVLWSDIVNGAAAAFAAAATDGGHAFGPAGGMPAATANAVEERRRSAAEEIRQTLRDRTERETLTAAAESASFGFGPVDSAEFGAFPSVIPGVDCIDDFAAYLADDGVRQAIIDRFTQKVKAELDAGSELDIVAHSWGTVVAYEGLRELEDQGLNSPRVRNFFTVGSALSLWPVRTRLRSTNRDGRRPANVRRWVNLDARGDVVGGSLRSDFAVDHDFVNLRPVGCGLIGRLRPKCAHSSYFDPGNVAVNRDIFAKYIDLP